MTDWEPPSTALLIHTVHPWPLSLSHEASHSTINRLFFISFFFLLIETYTWVVGGFFVCCFLVLVLVVFCKCQDINVILNVFFSLFPSSSASHLSS